MLLYIKHSNLLNMNLSAKVNPETVAHNTLDLYIVLLFVNI